MYKVGDKFICVKENDEVFGIKYTIGDIIQIVVEPIYISSLCVGYDCVYDDCIYVDKGVKETFFHEEINDYFIPLAEWREEQIKSVLE